MADDKFKTHEAIASGILQLNEMVGDVLDDMGGGADIDDILQVFDDDSSSDSSDDVSQHSGIRGTHGQGSGRLIFDNDSHDDFYDEKVKSSGDLDQIVEDLDIEEVDYFDDDEDEDDFLKQYKLVKEKVVTLEEQHEKQNIMDKACIMLLKPQYFEVTNRIERREMLRRNFAGVKAWPAQELDDTIVLVAESMLIGIGNTINMHDISAQLINTWDSYSPEQYMLCKVDLSQVPSIPSKYFVDSENIHTVPSGIANTMKRFGV